MNPAALTGQIAALDKSYNPTAIYNQATTQLGIPDARARVQALQTHLVNTQNAINAVDPSVTARTSGDLVTEAQRGRLVNVEQQPLQQDYTTQNQSYGQETQALNGLLGELNTQVGNETANYNAKRNSLATQLDTALKQQAAAESKREFNVSAAQTATKIANSGSGGGSGQVNPAQDFLNYISGQFKASGGAGNSKTSRQTQDSWANAWFAKNGVSNANRQQYWNLFNKTYNRTDDPTKDWRYAKK